MENIVLQAFLYGMMIRFLLWQTMCQTDYGLRISCLDERFNLQIRLGA